VPTFSIDTSVRRIPLWFRGARDLSRWQFARDLMSGNSKQET
jgi:hypothetical protein